VEGKTQEMETLAFGQIDPSRFVMIELDVEYR
jgi:hypothetical protein